MVDAREVRAAYEAHEAVHREVATGRRVERSVQRAHSALIIADRVEVHFLKDADTAHWVQRVFLAYASMIAGRVLEVDVFRPSKMIPLAGWSFRPVFNEPADQFVLKARVLKMFQVILFDENFR